jgi:alkylation response protein AidB-like acyl-CoA dehydrogenase
MDTRLSAEQRTLRDSAVQLVDRLGPRSVGQIDEPDRVARLDAAVTAAGWRELRTAADQDAPLASAVEAAVVAEELGRRGAEVAFIGPTLAADLRRLAGAPAGETLETVVLTPTLAEPAVVTAGVLVADAVALDARGSATALVLSPADGGFTLAEVQLPAAAAALDLTRPSAALDGETKARPLAVESGLRGPNAEAGLRGPNAEAGVITEAALVQWTALGLAIACADLVGTMRGAIDLGCDHAKERRQYGAPIGSFQAVQHLLADAFVAMEGSRSVALHAAWAVDALPAADALAATSVAKAYCARAARLVCETVIQVHGGIGNTWECLAHVHLRRALLSADVLGGEGLSLERVLDHHGSARRHGLH